MEFTPSCGSFGSEFTGRGWRIAELLAEVQASKDFYFDKLCQVRMPSWTKGRVALVGDAAYCASPAAGMGGSLAIDGAAALADALRERGGDFELAFRDYDAQFRPFVDQVQAEAVLRRPSPSRGRPFVDQVQAEAVRVGLEVLVPRTEEAIRARNAKTGSEF